MCESTVYIETPDGREKAMEEVARIEVAGTSITMSSVLGDERKVQGQIVSIDFLGHELAIRPV